MLYILLLNIYKMEHLSEKQPNWIPFGKYYDLLVNV